MAVIITVFYPLWYDSARAKIKDVVDTEDYLAAKTELDILVQEHATWLTELGNPKNRVYGEQLMLEHALAHLNTVIDMDDPEFINGDGSTGHQSDIVKQALLQEPKLDYS